LPRFSAWALAALIGCAQAPAPPVEVKPPPQALPALPATLVNDADCPGCLEVTAFTSEGEIMGLRHRDHPTYGVQFHPESILTQHGKTILQNFLDI